MTTELLAKFTPNLQSVTLLPSSGGRFEVTVGDALVYSKKALGRHAQPGEIATLLEEKHNFVAIPLD